MIKFNHDKQNVNIGVDQKPTTNYHKPQNFQITLSENIGLSENKPQQNTGSTDRISNGRTLSINLSEKIELTENTSASNIIAVIKTNDDSKTTMERISNYDRIRFNGKTIVRDNLLWMEQKPTKLSDLVDNKLSFQSSVQNIQDNLVGNFWISNPFLQESLYADKEIVAFFKTGDLIKIQLAVIIHDAADTKNPTILLLLVPLSGYILIRSEEASLNFFRSKKFLSFCCIVLLVGPMVFTPLSMSNYWNAYAQPDNKTKDNGNLIGPPAGLQNSVQTKSTQTTVQTNSTQPNHSTDHTKSTNTTIQNNSKHPKK
jgi:hypothetical protein